MTQPSRGTVNPGDAGVTDGREDPHRPTPPPGAGRGGRPGRRRWPAGCAAAMRPRRRPGRRPARPRRTCEENSTAAPLSVHASNIEPRNSRQASGSRLAIGSSSKNKAGRLASTRVSATWARCPPEREPTRACGGISSRGSDRPPAWRRNAGFHPGILLDELRRSRLADGQRADPGGRAQGRLNVGSPV